MKILFDTHTHTIASDHAYSTVMENARQAADMGMEAVAITDHGPKMDDAPHPWHFNNMKNIPREMMGIKMFVGIELNILDENGTVDMDDKWLQKFDVVNASIHGSGVYRGKKQDDFTKTYEVIMNNPYIDILCHSGSPEYKYDYRKIIGMAKEKHKLIEINNHTFFVRKANADNCREIAKICKELETGIVVTSDAHIATDIGNYEKALKMLNEIDFPEKLIMNRSVKAYEEYVSTRKRLGEWRLY